MFKLNQLLNDAKGATAIEYGLLLGLISMVMLGVLNSLGFTLAGVFETISRALGG
ncbi:MAG TPA: Flp family type IVb pilin [Allosphingosinicella sp.]|nr:Flp family type IVb pilin [Allosphingosinicella sp.]